MSQRGVLCLKDFRGSRRALEALCLKRPPKKRVDSSLCLRSFSKIIPVDQGQNVVCIEAMGQIEDDRIIVAVDLQGVAVSVLPGLREGFAIGIVQLAAPEGVQDNLMTACPA